MFADCPNCGKGNKHWNLSLKSGLSHCYKCGFDANFKQLIHKVTGYWRKISDVEKENESELTLKTLREIFAETEDRPETSEETPDWTEGTCDITAQGRVPALARDYLEGRGVSTGLAKSLQMKVGLEGRYQNYILIPVTEDGNVKNFVARRFMGRGKRFDGPHKTENYPSKSSFVWGLDRVNAGDYITVVEGIFDALSILDKNPVALLSKTISAVQAYKIVTKASSCVVLLDGGFGKDAMKVAKRLVGFIPVKVAFMEPGLDPGANPNEAKEAIENAKDFYEL